MESPFFEKGFLDAQGCIGALPIVYQLITETNW